MTPRQRWLALFDRSTPDRLPTDYWATDEFHAKLKAHLRVNDDESLWQCLQIDRPCFTGAVHRPPSPIPEGLDMWGVRRRNVDYGTGVYAETVDPPLASFDSVQQVLDYPWPSFDDMDVSGVPDHIARLGGDRVLLAGWYEPFLLYCALRGMEQAYEDLICAPDLAHAILTRIFEFHYESNRKLWSAGGGRIDLMYLAEDLGAQTGPLFSLSCYREFLMPNQKKMAALAKSFGIRVFYHTDGSARPFLPDLIDEVGIDILNPLQWVCPGMELEGLVRDFGDKLVFHGGIDNQHTLPFGSEDDVRQQVRQVAAIMRGARWICAPCHNIQNVSPVQNVIAMYDEASKVAVA